MNPVRDTYWNVPDWSIILMYVLLVGLAIPAFVYQIYRHVQIWRQGQPVARFDHPADRFILVVDYAIAQLRVTLQKFAGMMHLGIFWGMVILFIGTLLVLIDQDILRTFFGLRFLTGDFYLGFEAALDIFGVFLAIGLVMGLYRRYVGQWERLGKERTFAFALVSLLVIDVTGYMIEAFRLAATKPQWGPWSPAGFLFAGLFWNAPEGTLRAWHLGTWLFHMLVVGVFIAVLPKTNLIHLVTTPLNIFFDRLEPKRGILTPMDLENTEIYGVGELEQFTWKQRLGFDSCTYCGRCQAACPAYAAGTPLSPKNVIVKLEKYTIGAGEMLETVGEHAEAAPAVSANGSGPDGDQPAHGGNGAVRSGNGVIHDANRPPVAKPMLGEDGIINPEELWACTTCIACIVECPVFIEILEDIVDMRRYLALSEGELKPTAASAMTQVERQGNPWGYSAANRTDWIGDLEVPLAEAGEEYDLLYWVGCSASYDARNQKIARSMAKILNAAGLKFAIMAEETCCGDPARRLGNEYLYQMLAQTNVENLNQYTFKRLVASCPHGFNTIKNEYPQFGGNYRVIHHSQLIRELLQQGRLELQPGAERRIVFHDSCYLGRYNDVYDAPRATIDAVPGMQRVEVARSRVQGFCCGGGGGNMFQEVEGKTRVNYVRMDQLMAVDPQTIGVACPFCLTMLDDARKVKGAEERIGVKDIAELVAEALAAQAPAAPVAEKEA